jgi:hypothetical protein
MGPFCNPLNWEWLRQREEQIASRARRREPRPARGTVRDSEPHATSGHREAAVARLGMVRVLRVQDVPSACEAIMNRGVRSIIGPLHVDGHMEALVVDPSGEHVLISDRLDRGTA